MRSLLIVLFHEHHRAWAEAVKADARAVETEIFVGDTGSAAQHIATHRLTPTHIVLDIGPHGQEILPAVDALAQQCEPGTRVIAIGDTNDVQLYRGLLARGVIDYLPMPVAERELVDALRAPAPLPPPSVTRPQATPAAADDKRVITFMSAASGDGASTAALNVAFTMSNLFKGRTVLVDMDYQFGMVAKQLDLQNQYGIRDLFDHPDRGIDTLLIRRMVANYGQLHVITAPAELRYLPNVSAEAVRELINTLKQSYQNIILDMPHVWLPWMAAACQESTQLVLIAQLWLKSVSHAARLMKIFREIGVPQERIWPVINRAGAKFKEAVDQRDFERVCATNVRYSLTNDIKTIVTAEAEARTVVELDASQLSTDINRLARALSDLPAEAETTLRGAGSLLARFRV